MSWAWSFVLALDDHVDGTTVTTSITGFVCTIHT
jgi:hypothetical protein